MMNSPALVALRRLALASLLAAGSIHAVPAMAGGIVLDLPNLVWPEDMAAPAPAGGAVMGTKSATKP